MKRAAGQSRAEPGEARALKAERQRFVSELFHTVAKPLTSLRMALELALFKARPAKEYRESLEEALEQANRLSQLMVWTRELAEAENPGAAPLRVKLNEIAEELVEDWRPVAEMRGIALYLEEGEAEVWVDPARLRQALFHIMQYALSACPRGADVTVRVNESGEKATLGIETTELVDFETDLKSGRADIGEIVSAGSSTQEALGMAKRLIDVMSGTLIAGKKGGKSHIRVQLPKSEIKREIEELVTAV